MAERPVAVASRPATSRLSQCVALRESVLQGLREAESAGACIEAFLFGVCSTMRWPAAVAYVIDPASPRMLTPTHQAYLDKAHMERAIQIVSLRPPSGRGLGTFVLDTGEPAWIEDLTHSSGFSVPMQAGPMGVRGALAVPVYVGNRLGIVAEFFTPEPFDADPGVLWSLSHVTTRLGMRIAELNREALGNGGKKKPT